LCAGRVAFLTAARARNADRADHLVADHDRERRRPSGMAFGVWTLASRDPCPAWSRRAIRSTSS
jgi:hypothetical protein